MSKEFIRPIDYVSIGKYNHAKTRDRGIRLYSTASAETHGKSNARYSMQIFAPITNINGREGKDYVIASASMSLDDLIALGAAVKDAIAEITKAKERGSHPR